MKLLNKVALITGCASGMGKAQALLFAKEGANIIAADINTEGNDKTVAEINGSGGNAISVVVDLRKKSSIEAAVSQGLEHFGKIDILCNTGGVFDGKRKSLDTTEEFWDLVLDIDLKGVFLMCNAVLPGMLENKSGVIVNLASTAGLTVGCGGASYTAAKHALVGYTKQLSHEYGQQGIRANAICPGAVKTGITANIDPDILKASASAIPAMRTAEADEIAQLSLFLASEESNYIYGAAIPIDGGLLVK